MFVVDDIFSSLDKKTQKLVWDNVFGPNGIVRELGSSAIIATHSRKPSIASSQSATKYPL